MKAVEFVFDHWEGVLAALTTITTWIAARWGVSRASGLIRIVDIVRRVDPKLLEKLLLEITRNPDVALGTKVAVNNAVQYSDPKQDSPTTTTVMVQELAKSVPYVAATVLTDALEKKPPPPDFPGPPTGFAP